MGICGGPSSAETIAQGEQSSLALNMNADFAQRFAQQSVALQGLQSAFAPIVAAGPEQQGFSAEELAAKNTAAINNAGTANRNAQQAAGNAIAGQNNTTGLDSGITKAIKAGIASNSANNLANQQNQIVQQNYDVGRSNYQNAVAGTQALIGDYNPQSYGSGAQSGFSNSFSEADKINSENVSVGQGILGAVTSLGKDALGFVTGGLSNVLAGGSQAGSETGGGAEQFFSGGMSALQGNIWHSNHL